ncbi:MAG: ABC transporter ATP-binding protein [Dehalococcoidia bacterium]|jgi:zinc transport system ATP-binding protein
MTPEAALAIEDVWVRYDGVTVLEGVSLSVDRGAFLGIIGPNGGGKTTLLKVILGLVKPTQGRVSVLGRPPERSHRYIGYVPQYNLFDRNFPISVRETVLMGCNGTRGLMKRYSREDKERAQQALETVGMLAYQDHQIGRLSGGEQQRVFIARALVGRPKLLLLDEPTASVDSALQTGFYELLVKLKDEMTIIMVSHDISAISIYVDEIACLNRQLFYHGSKELEPEVLEATYKCPVQLIAHGTIPHRVLKEHK